MSKFYPVAKRQDFVGLSNQGATCYMNSLLQTLYMTPEFRREIYKWLYEDKHGPPENCIPLQLQLLFTKLQTSSSYSVDTIALTKSFGWEQSECFQQHDVQEFCRVLFDAIEKNASNGNKIKFIQELYEGKYADYVRCLACANESIREDKFLDLSLTINNRFEGIYNDSVDKALRNYVKPEHLSGQNQYYCENCKSKQDALKGLKFKELPYILVLQLKRFDFDYTTNKRIKINDKVSFEEIMDLNHLMKQINFESCDMEVDQEEQVGIDYLDLPEMENKNFQVKASRKNESLFSNQAKLPLKMDPMRMLKYQQIKSAKKQEKIRERVEGMLKKGEYVYELYSIMIHSGSAWGGHYFAYIKCFETGKWYNFNDSNVTEISHKEIPKVFGEKATWGTSSSAYLLMYRKIDYQKNVTKVENEEITEKTQEFLDWHKKKLEEDELRRRENLKKIIVRVIHNKLIKDVHVKSDDTFETLKKAAIIAHGLQVSEENARIRDIDISDKIGQVFQNESIVSRNGINHSKRLVLETKLPSEVFEEYDPNKLNFKVFLWKDSYSINTSLEDIIDHPDFVRVNRYGIVRDLVEAIIAKFNIALPNLKLFKKSLYGNYYAIEPFHFQRIIGDKLGYSMISDNTLIFAEIQEDSTQKSNWQLLYEQESKKMLIKVSFLSEISQPIMKISMHPHRLLSELKDLISNKSGIPVDQMILRNLTNMTEIKDLSQPVSKILSSHELQVSRGQPLNTNQIRIGFYLSTPNIRPLKDSEFFTLHFLFECPVDLEWSIKTLRDFLSTKTHEYFPSIPINYLRLREIQNDKLTKWLDEKSLISEVKYLDGKKIALQLLDYEDLPKEKDDIIVAVRKINTVTWELGPAVDFKLTLRSTLHNFAESLSGYFELPLDQIEVCKISSMLFNRYDLLNARFEKLGGRNDKAYSQPLYVGEGSLLILKDSSTKLREMTAKEKLKFAPKTSAGVGKFMYREKDLKISVWNS